MRNFKKLFRQIVLENYFKAGGDVGIHTMSKMIPVLMYY